jgi:hypothetical protein
LSINLISDITNWNVCIRRKQVCFLCVLRFFVCGVCDKGNN